jgi:hypothetical protein
MRHQQHEHQGKHPTHNGQIADGPHVALCELKLLHELRRKAVSFLSHGWRIPPNETLDG